MKTLFLVFALLAVVPLQPHPNAYHGGDCSAEYHRHPRLAPPSPWPSAAPGYPCPHRPMRRPHPKLSATP